MYKIGATYYKLFHLNFVQVKQSWFENTEFYFHGASGPLYHVESICSGIKMLQRGKFIRPVNRVFQVCAVTSVLPSPLTAKMPLSIQRNIMMKTVFYKGFTPSKLVAKASICFANARTSAISTTSPLPLPASPDSAAIHGPLGDSHK